MAADSKINPRVLSSFLTDALRLSAEANQAVQALHSKVTPARVQHLYQVLHTLKGTASMVHGCEKIVKALHHVEARLATSSLADTARNTDWLPDAREAVAVAHEALLEIQAQAKASAPPRERISLKGILARTTIGERDELLWFPLSSLVKVLAPEVLADREVMCVHGAWVPVLGVSRQSPRRCVGLVAKSGDSTAVIAAHEVVSVVSWTVAAQQGARSGIDFIFGASGAAAALAAAASVTSAAEGESPAA